MFVIYSCGVHVSYLNQYPTLRGYRAMLLHFLWKPFYCLLLSLKLIARTSSMVRSTSGSLPVMWHNVSWCLRVGLCVGTELGVPEHTRINTNAIYTPAQEELWNSTDAEQHQTEQQPPRTIFTALLFIYLF